MDSPSDWDRVAKLRRCTAGLKHLVTMVSMVWIISCSLRVKKSALVLRILFWTESSQRLYNWAAICDGGMVVSCLNTPQSILNLQNCWFVISSVISGGLIGGHLLRDSGGMVGIELVMVVEVASGDGWEKLLACCMIAKMSPIIVTPRSISCS